MGLREVLRRPAREQPAAVAVLALLAVAAIAVVLLLGHHSSPSRPGATVSVAVSSPVIGTRRASSASAPALTAAQLAAARQVARRFLASYLPVLYGRRLPRTIRDADAHVRTALQTAPRPPRAPRDRRPRFTGLTLKQQSGGSVLAVTTIADHVTAPYQLVFTLGQRSGGWQVTELANY